MNATSNPASEPALPSRACNLGIVVCIACGRAAQQRRNLRGQRYCARCAAPLYTRKPNSLSRTWAFLIAAAVLYIPANMLPIMSRRTLFGDYDNTILNGVLELWQDGAWDLAIIVFTASIVVPLLKLLALLVLLLSIHRGSTQHLQERARLYRIIEFVGQWSMLDIFVVALLVALVHFRQLAEISAGSGAVAFGAVVVLTMLASQSFDPRLIWDAAENLPLDDEADELPATSPHFGTPPDAPP